MTAALIYLVRAIPADLDGIDRPLYFSGGQCNPQRYGGTRWRECLGTEGPPFSFDESIPLGDALGGPSAPGFGVLKLTRDAASLGELGSYVWDGRPLTIWRGPEGAAFPGGFEVLFDGATADAPTYSTDGRVTLPLQDSAAVLNVPAQPRLYLGTGRYEGFAGMKGTRPPLVLGTGLQFEPTALDHTAPGANDGTFSRVIQLHDGPVQRVPIVAISEKGRYFGAANHVDVPDVYAWAPTAADVGKVAVDYARGVARTALAPAGILTAGVTAADTIQFDGATVAGFQSHARVAAGLCLRDGTLTLAQIDVAAFAELDTETPDPAGLVVTDELAKGAALDVLARSCGAFWQMTPPGQLRMRRIAFRTPVAVIRRERFTGRLEQLPAELPVWQLRFGSHPRERPLSDTDIGAVGMDPRVLEDLRSATTYHVLENATTKARRRLARSVTVDSRFHSDAGPTEGARQAFLLAQYRRRFLAPLRFPYGTFRLGDTVTLQYDDFGLEGGEDYLILGKRELPRYQRDEDRVELQLWGPRVVGLGVG